MEFAVAHLLHTAHTDELSRADAMYQLVVLSGAHGSALRSLAGPVAVSRLLDIAESCTPDVEAFVAWIIARTGPLPSLPRPFCTRTDR